MKTISTVLPKREVQAMIRALRDAGLNVEKTDSGYSCEAKGQTVFKAMTGSQGYLVRMADNLFV